MVKDKTVKETNNVFTLYEVFNKQALKYIINNKEDFRKLLTDGCDPDYDPFEQVRRYLLSERNGRVKINYTYGKGRSSGRVYSKMGLQGMCKKLRHTIAGEFYQDIDIINCHPTILQHMCKRSKIKADLLTHYNNNRDEVLRTISKKTVLEIIYGCSNDNINDPWLIEFYNEMKSVRRALCKINNEFFLQVKRDNVQNGKRRNHDGTCISLLLQDKELEILKAMLTYFKDQSIVDDEAVLCHDGIMIPNDRELSDDDLIECEEFIRDECKINVKLKSKPMSDGLELPDDLPEYPDYTSTADLEYVANTCETQEDVKDLLDTIVEVMNKSYCIIKCQRTFYLEEIYDNGEIDRVFKNKESMTNDFANQKYNINIGKKEIKIDIFNIWNTSPDRRSYKGIKFDPEDFYYPRLRSHTPYNLFRGLKIERDTLSDIDPLPETEAVFHHIRSRWCNDNLDQYNYVLDFMAHCIQFPWRKMKACLVLQSMERSGKGMIIQLLKEIIGSEYFFQPSSSNDVLGNFNGGLKGKLIVFLDEMVWGGDKEKAGTFKKLITEGEMTINEKYEPLITTKNISNLFIASNEDWVVPAGSTSTRYMVLELNNELATLELDKTSKNQIIQDIINTDIKSFAKFLYERDITSFNPTDIVVTDALRVQKTQSLSPMGKWFLDALNNGGVFNHGLALGAQVSKQLIFQDYIDSSKDKHTKKTLFWKMFKRYVGETTDKRVRVDGIRQQAVGLPSLEYCQNKWRSNNADEGWAFDTVEDSSATDGITLHNDDYINEVNTDCLIPGLDYDIE